MTRKEKYEYIKMMYEIEAARETLLNDRTKTNLTLVTLYSGFLLFVAEKLRPIDLMTKLTFSSSTMCFLGAFLTTLWAYRVREYERPTEPRKIALSTEEVDQYLVKISDFVVAFERNHEVNNIKAAWLEKAGYLMFMGMVFHACYFMFQLVL